MAGVGGGRDDLGVDRRRRHTGQQHRRAAGEPGELGRQLHRAVRQGDRGGRITRPGLADLGGRADGKQVALSATGGGRHDSHAEPPDDRCGQPGQDVARAEVENPVGAGLFELADGVHPVDLADQNVVGHPAGQPAVQAHRFGPPGDEFDAVGQPGGVEADLDVDRIEHRREHRPAAQFVLALGGLGVGDLPAVQLEAGELLGGSGDDHRAAAVADGQHRRQDGADVPGEIVEQRGDAFRFDVGHRDHRRTVTERDDAPATGHQRAGGADELGQCQQLHVHAAAGLQRRDGQHALGVTGRGDGRGIGEVQTLAGQRPDGRDLGQQNAGQRHRRRGQLMRRRNRLRGRQCPHPPQRFEADRADHDDLIGHRLQQQLGLAGDSGEFGLDSRGGDEFLQAGEP